MGPAQPWVQDNGWYVWGQDPTFINTEWDKSAIIMLRPDSTNRHIAVLSDLNIYIDWAAAIVSAQPG